MGCEAKRLGIPKRLHSRTCRLRIEAGLRADNPETHALESWGTRLIWDALPEDLDGKPITVSVTLTDAAGTTLDASVDLLIEDPTL